MLETLKGSAKSKTIWFMSVMAVLEATAANLHYIQNLITEQQFALFSFVLSIVLSTGGIMLRTVTTVPLSEK